MGVCQNINHLHRALFFPHPYPNLMHMCDLLLPIYYTVVVPDEVKSNSLKKIDIKVTTINTTEA